jgi:hypothetical protein
MVNTMKLELNTVYLNERDIFSSPPRPDRFRGPPSLLTNVYRVALTPKVKRQDLHAPICFHDVVWVK